MIVTIDTTIKHTISSITIISIITTILTIMCIMINAIIFISSSTIVTTTTSDLDDVLGAPLVRRALGHRVADDDVEGAYT